MQTEKPVAGSASSQRDLSLLLEWLSAQKGGAGTFYEFQQRADALRRERGDHAALLRLLAGMAERFADAFEGEPLPVSVATAALEELTGYVRRAAAMGADRSRDYVDLLDAVGRADLGTTN